MNYTLSAPVLGLTSKERNSYSVAGLIRAVAERDQFEVARYRELSTATAKATGQPELSTGFYMPADVLGAPQQRTMTTTSGPAGGYAVATEIAGYAAALNRASLIGQLQITRLDDLRANVVIPSQTLQHETVWAAEGAEAAPSQGTFGNITMTPRTAISMVTVSRQLLVQMGAAGQRFIDRQLGVSVAEAIDTALLQGAGGAQPIGILNALNVDTRTGNAFDMAAAAAMLKVAEGYANDDSIAFVAGVDAAEVLRKRAKAANTAQFMVEGNEMLGRPFIVSRSMPAAKLICAPWSSVMLGSWGAPEIRIDASTYFESGAVRVGIFSMVDTAVERPQSIAIATAVS